MSTAPLQILIDGQCPLCRREGDFLLRLDRGRGRIALIDIAAPDFNPAQYNTTFDEAMARIHARAPDGRLITGLEVFRRAYALVCPPLGWLWAPTGWPGIRVVADAAYRWFARNRYRFRAADRCDSGRCDINRNAKASAPDAPSPPAIPTR
ncbi:MAG: DUF393 domain-containing protein [Phycisphaerae bacterium]|nr:DUF393 domain-containing protein [Phycisphaerae bacterium]